MFSLKNLLGNKMKFKALQNSSAVLAVLVASSAFASMTTLTASDITGTGEYAQSPTKWKIQFTFDGDLAQTSLDGDFGNWTLTVTGSNGKSWSKSKNETNGGSYTGTTNEKIYVVDIGDGTDGNGGLTPPPTNLSLKYTTKKISGNFMTLGEALDYSALSSTPDIERGRLSVTHVDGEGTELGEISGTFSVPTPGAVALIGLAGMVAGRRRRN